MLNDQTALNSKKVVEGNVTTFFELTLTDWSAYFSNQYSQIRKMSFCFVPL